MKLIIYGDRIAAVATDDYVPSGDEDAVLDAPEDFDQSKVEQYRFVDGELTLAAPLRRVTKLAFRNRFTQQEKVMIDLASIDDPTKPLNDPARLHAAAIRVNLKDTEAASYIDLDRADTRAGVQALEAGGIIAAGRALEILDAPVTDGERFKT